MNLSTKSETLSELYGKLSNAVVLPQVSFTVKEWREYKMDTSILSENRPTWLDDLVIVRSSSQSEDSNIQSLAGHYVSVGNIQGNKHLESAINSVVESYTDNNQDNLIFIQPFLTNVERSGVAFTLDPNNASHYYVINYDEETGSTNTVTDGSSNNLNTLYFSKHDKHTDKKWLIKLIDLLKELEEYFNSDSLDIEFAFDKSNVLYLFQVRPLILRNKQKVTIQRHKKMLQRVEEHYHTLSKPHPYLLGKKSIFGVMPDWNPAEIIGIRPRPLALSLYKKLITDRNWSYQRNNYGYRNLRSFPLLVTFSGLPYIDVRVSFNSFVSNDLDESLANKLVEYYIDRLEKNPSSHDKVEFEIIYSCYTLDLPERISILESNSFSKNECKKISSSLRKLTNNVISGKDALWKKDIKKIDKLKIRQKTILSSQLSKIEKIFWLLEDCGRYGTLPFAGLARAGFIALQILKSMISTQILTVDEYDSFMASLKTVSTGLSDDIASLSKNNFLNKYGHLRPGTYDILSSRYDIEPSKYFEWNDAVSDKNDTEHKDFSLSKDSMNRLNHLLSEHKLEVDAKELLKFIKGAIEGREYAKFIFTKSLSDSLELVKQLGNENGISIEDISYSNIEGFFQIYSEGGNIKKVLEDSIEIGKHNFQETESISLPPMITQSSDVWMYELPKNEPNYITMKTIQGKIIDEEADKSLFPGSILFIPSADPGYDWIFSRNIGGFVTMYGGVNSHMAIRASEMAIPAVIGCGELLYKQWFAAKVLEISCSNRSVKILQ
jgi:glutamine kinase